jgi:uncharacterized protein
MTARSVVRVASVVALSLAGVVTLATGPVGFSTPAAAQFWGSDPFFRPPRPQRTVPQPQAQDPFGGFFQQAPFWQQRTPRPPRQVGDSSKAPPPKKADTPPTTNVVVLGDAMADWLAHGLEEAYADNNEIGVVRKIKPNTGLIQDESRRDSTDWVQQARDLLASERPDFVVMMIGLSDRIPIRERAAAAARPGQQIPARPGQQPQAGQQPQPGPQAQQAPQAPQDGEAAPAEAPPKPEQPATPQRPGTTTSHEFRSERWTELYGKRIDDTIAALKSKGVPVLWVGIAPVRGPRSRNDLTYLNDLFRARAQKAGITFVDVWDGFVDEDGNFNLRGPDYNGQIRQLRSADGVYFTKAGAVKLGHYVEREIQRMLANRGMPVALPAPEPSEQAPARPGVPAPRPVAGPIVPLTAATTAREDLAGSGPGRAASVDPVAARVLQRGEAAPVATGRADDFSWPRPDTDDGTIIPAALPATAAPAVTRPGAKKGPAPAEKGPQKKGPAQAATPPAAKQPPR